MQKLKISLAALVVSVAALVASDGDPIGTIEGRASEIWIADEQVLHRVTRNAQVSLRKLI